MSAVVPSKGADFRDTRSQRKSDFGWLKSIGKLGFPIHLLLKMYQLTVVWVDLILMGLETYKEIWLSVLRFLLPMRKKSVSNEVAIIVGSSRGIGREIAYKLANLNSTVICIDVQTPDREEVSKQIVKDGKSAFYFQCNITDKDEVEKTIERIRSEVGAITFLFHCCSLPSPRAVVNIKDSTSVKETFDLSVTSYFYLLDSILPHMKANKKGHIVFLTSVAAISGFTQQLALSVSQFAVQGLYESIVEELRIGKLEKVIKTTLVHIYPFIVSENLENDIRLRVPGFFGSIRADKAADALLDGVRKNKAEISIPKYCLFISHILKVLPRKVTLRLRDFLDTGVDF